MERSVTNIANKNLLRLSILFPVLTIGIAFTLPKIMKLSTYEAKSFINYYLIACGLGLICYVVSFIKKEEHPKGTKNPIVLIVIATICTLIGLAFSGLSLSVK